MIIFLKDGPRTAWLLNDYVGVNILEPPGYNPHKTCQGYSESPNVPTPRQTRKEHQSASFYQAKSDVGYLGAQAILAFQEACWRYKVKVAPLPHDNKATHGLWDDKKAIEQQILLVGYGVHRWL